MFTMRTAGAFGLCIVLICISLYVYTEYTNRQYQASLPPLRTETVEEKTRIPTATSQTQEGFRETAALTDDPAGSNPAGSNPVRVDVPVDDAVLPVASESFPESVLDPEIYEMSSDEIDQILDEAFDFKFTDLDAMYASLEEALTTRFGDDARVPRLLDLWEASYYIIQKVNELNRSGGDVTPLLEMFPGYVFREASEIGISLFNHDAASAMDIRRQVDHIETEFEKMEMATIAGPMVEEAYRNGEITVDEAKVFFKAATGLELVVSEE